MPRVFRSPAWLAIAAGLCTPALAGAQPTNATQLPSNQVTTVNGVKTACTGVGSVARADPRWKDFAVRLEAASPSGDLLGGLTVDIANDRGTSVLTASCASPWLLMDLPPGSYRVTAWSGRRGPRTVTVQASAGRQTRSVVAFPKAAPAS
ncbi:MAG TPA: hypothetical protein VK801_19730 [Caulobacteraceae bacterium]|nr:hypothetical protein [Caulobacteraceae bacterium]